MQTKPKALKTCATALAAAQAAQDAVAPDTVILFGSRARGDHRPDSDIDLLVIHQQHEALDAIHKAKAAARARIGADRPDPPVVQITAISRENFRYARRADNHVAGQALRDGVVISAENLKEPPNREDEYPRSWPDVKERIIIARRNLGYFNRMLTDDFFGADAFGYYAQQAIENILKAWLSAAGLTYRRVHDIEELTSKLLTHPTEAETPAAAQLRRLLSATRYEELPDPAQAANWLTKYAEIYRHLAGVFIMTPEEKEQFQRMVNETVTVATERAHQLTGTGPADLEEPGTMPAPAGESA